LFIIIILLLLLNIVSLDALYTVSACFTVWNKYIKVFHKVVLIMVKPFKTKLTELLKIQVPLMSAGMAGIAGPELVAAVSNAGGIGTIGAIGLSPVELRACIRRTRNLTSKPIGIDLLLPKIGGNARKTNKDYTGGKLKELIDVMIEEKIELFVCAVGVPPRWVVDKLHNSGIIVMNIIGSPKHVSGCIKAGVDIVAAQGTEAGAHTGAITTLVLLPQVADALKGTGILLVGAGGIYDGRGVAASFALGCDGVWLGSRFIMTPEANGKGCF
jgi:NAD(P)H-dependent flavin oxidoreductase YrpB (nitropropane dioxygenase family)